VGAAFAPCPIRGFDIRYRSELDGGGTDFGQQFIPFLRSRGMPKQKRAFEWCCGPGFIGFSMLGHGLWEILCLSDINPAAASCQHTVRVNKLSDRVSVCQSDNLKSIPRSEMWNLIVSNPPHFVDQYEGDIRAHDPDWRIHRNFFETVSDHLAEDGVIVLQENNRGFNRRDLSGHN
jgi:methylase of polypeptide subunit release factors